LSGELVYSELIPWDNRLVTLYSDEAIVKLLRRRQLPIPPVSHLFGTPVRVPWRAHRFVSHGAPARGDMFTRFRLVGILASGRGKCSGMVTVNGRRSHAPDRQ
jgi:hypothetical protein